MSVNSNRFSLSKRCNQIYYIGYYLNGRRKWKSTGATVKSDALKTLTQFKELLQARGGSVSFEQFNTQFLSYGEANYSPKTLTLYRAILARFLRVVRNISLPELTSQHIDRYKSERLKAVKARGKQGEQQRVSPTSVNVELRMLKAAFNTARRWKLLDLNPFDGVRLAEVPEREPLFFSSTDFERLVG